MTEDTKRNRLGRGLSALLGETDLDVVEPVRPDGPFREVPIEFLVPNPFQPRRQFDEETVRELAESIREKGILQPLIVRAVEGESESYQIIAGERRWRAAQMARLHSVPVVVRRFSDSEALEVALIENIQRSDLGPIEEARGYRDLIERFGHTQEQLGQLVGKSRSYITNMLRLLGLPERVQNWIEEGTLSAGHGRALLGSEQAEALAERVIADHLSVRQTEALVKAPDAPVPSSRAPSSPRGTAQPVEKDADTLALENNVSNALGLKVTIQHRGEKGGDVQISYKTLEQLDEICRRLSREG